MCSIVSTRWHASQARQQTNIRCWPHRARERISCDRIVHTTYLILFFVFLSSLRLPFLRFTMLNRVLSRATSRLATEVPVGVRLCADCWAYERKGILFFFNPLNTGCIVCTCVYRSKSLSRRKREEKNLRRSDFMIFGIQSFLGLGARLVSLTPKREPMLNTIIIFM